MDLQKQQPTTAEKTQKKKLTKAERKAAKKLQAEELRKKQLRDHLQRELLSTEMNWRNIKSKFMEMMKKIKFPEMKEDAMTIWRTFEHSVDGKNYAISEMLDFLDETELQYRVNLQKHVETIDELIDFYIKEMDKLKNKYDIELSEMKEKNCDVQSSMDKKQKPVEDQLKTVMLAMEENIQNFMTNFNSDSIAKIEDDKSKAAELLQNLRVILERRLESLWNELKGVLVNYQESTLHLKNQVKFLQRQDFFMAYTLQDQLKRTQALYGKIRKLKRSLATLKETQTTLLSDLINERQQVVDITCTMKKELKNEQEQDYNQLVLLTTESNVTMRWLDNIIKKGENILKMAAMCRKLETQQEKVSPFPTSLISPSIEDCRVMSRTSQPLIQIMYDFKDMESFWSRVGQAEVKKVEILHYYELLVLENHYLYEAIKRYLLDVPPLSPSTKLVQDTCIIQK